MRRHPYTSIEKPAFASAVLLAMVVSRLSLVCAADPVDFRSQIAPLLERHCLRCHNPGNQKGELSLATLADAKSGGESGPAITPADASHSRLIEMITPDASGQADMPEDTSPLKPEQIDLLRRWIDAGAAWPEDITLREPSRADRSSGQPVIVSTTSIQTRTVTRTRLATGDGGRTCCGPCLASRCTPIPRRWASTPPTS